MSVDGVCSPGVLGTWKAPSGPPTERPLCLAHQAAVLHLPAEVERGPGEGPVVGARYDSLDVLFEVLKRPVPPHSGQEVHLGGFFEHLRQQGQDTGSGGAVRRPLNQCASFSNDLPREGDVGPRLQFPKDPRPAPCPATYPLHTHSPAPLCTRVLTRPPGGGEQRTPSSGAHGDRRADPGPWASMHGPAGVSATLQ